MGELKNQLLEAIKSFIDERFHDLESQVKSLESENTKLKQLVESLPKNAVNGIDGAPGKDGQDGKDGKSFDALVAKEMLDLMFAPYKMKLEGIKDGQDGRDGKDGQDGSDGANGKDGKSAYDIAVKYGFKGTELEFAQKQFGQNGKDGEKGKDGKDGLNGTDGAPGKSAYEIAVDHGFKGTQLEFVQKQFGHDGKDGQNGKDGLNGVDGSPGKSAYEIAVDHGFKGTQLEFAQKQFGKDGQDGRNGIDGIGFDDLKVEFDGERAVSLKFVGEGNTKSYEFSIPAMIYKGVYKDGQNYQVGDTVTDNGSLWTCLKETNERPISADKGYWQLAVKHGRQGEKGSSGMSAYELSIKNGFKGSEKEYLASIRRGLEL